MRHDDLSKFLEAVETLATSTSDWRDRLYNAYLCIQTVDPDEEMHIDPEIRVGTRKRFRKLIKALTRVKAEDGKTDLKAAIAQMDEKVGGRWLADIYHMYLELAVYRDL
jgi:hypothetical protein